VVAFAVSTGLGILFLDALSVSPYRRSASWIVSCIWIVTVDAQLRELPVQSVAGWAGFVLWLCVLCLSPGLSVTHDPGVSRSFHSDWPRERSLESFDSPWVISHIPICDANGIRGRL
jgi:hypothetical protein